MDGWTNKINKGRLKQFISHRHVQNQSLGLGQAFMYLGLSTRRQTAGQEGRGRGHKSRVYGVSMDR